MSNVVRINNPWNAYHIFEAECVLSPDVQVAVGALWQCAQRAHELTTRERRAILAAIGTYRNAMDALADALEEREAGEHGMQ